MPNTVYVDEQLFHDAEQVLERIGLDVNTVIKMTLKRVVRDGGIFFLVADAPKIEITPTETDTAIEAQVEQDRITKSAAVNLFKSHGIITNRNVTFASKNKASNFYWANPSFDVLKQDWYLILNDWMKKELHMFKIPTQMLKPTDLVCRADNNGKVDLQIGYNDITFTDSRSKTSFAPFLVQTITY